MKTFKKLNVLLLFAFLLMASCEKKESFGGLALYTVRDDMAKDPKATLQKVADDGYAYIEAASYENGLFYGMPPEEFKTFVNSLGMSPKSAHMGSVTIENINELVKDAKQAGFEYFVVPVPPMGMFKYDEQTKSMRMEGTAALLSEVLNLFGEKCNEVGMQLLYHNHDFELKTNDDGIKVLDYLLENCPPEKVNFQLDLYWATKAGADPIAYFEKYPGRFKSWHVKDMDDQGRFAPVGTGTIDFSKIRENKEKSGMEYYFVEQDKTFDTTPLEAIKISHDALKGLGFE